MKEQIIQYIEKNKVSTTEVADCLGKTGCLHGIHTVNRGHFRVGEIFYTYATDNSSWKVHEDIQMIPERTILFIDTFNCANRSPIGELVSKFVLLYQQAEAIIVNGNIRDAGNIIKENYSVWCRGFNPEGCFHTNEYADISEQVKTERIEQFSGAIAVCDDGGVVIIPKKFHTKEFLEKLEKIEEQEDIWFDCIDRKKWTTFDTVCLKKYLNKE